MRCIWLGCALLVVLTAGQGVNADDRDPNDPNYPSDPEVLLRTRWDAVVTVLQNAKLDQKAKEARIGKIVTPIFDFPLMAKLALGRSHWPRLTKQQQEKFTRLFIATLNDSWREKITLYQDEKVLFKPAVRNKKSKTTIYIPTELIHKEEKIAVVYRLHKVGKRWKIYDLEIQGVSILLTYRSQFDDILSKGSVSDFLARLERRQSP